jgi:hypothetical protein
MSMKAPKWTGVIDAEGKLHMDSARVFRAWMKTLANQPVEFVLRKVTKIRSRNQNAYWWGVVVPMFAEACGYAPYEHEAVHDELMRVLVGLKADAHPALKIRQSSADLTTEEFNVLIEQAQIFGATKLGIVIPDPEPMVTPKPRGNGAYKRRTAA